MTIDKALIPGAGEGLGQPTPEAASGVSNETPANTNPPVDVDALRAEYDAKLQKYEGDLSQMKSSFQKREAQVTKEWQEKYDAAQRQLHEARKASMTEDERARYERQMETEEFQTLQSRLAEIENEKNIIAATYSAKDYFISQGVPANLLDVSEGYDALVSKGWQHLTEELARLRSAQANPEPQKPVEPAPLKEAPPVVTDKGTPGSGTTWTMLRDKFGSDEAVYRAVEEGRLDPSILPSN